VIAVSTSPYYVIGLDNDESPRSKGQN